MKQDARCNLDGVDDTLRITEELMLAHWESLAEKADISSIVSVPQL